MNTPSSPADPSKTDSTIRRLARKILAIIKQKDTPHRIALGLAFGIFVGILPIMGIQMSVVTLVALPFRANLKAAVAGVWISNPITFIPMYWGYYKFGLIFYPSRQVSWEAFIEMIKEAGELDWSALGESLDRILDIGMDILLPMWTGAAVLAVVFSIPTYFVTRWWVVRHRMRKKAARS